MIKDIVQQADVQLLFDAGALVKTTAVKAPMEDGYNLIFEGKNKQIYILASARKPKDVRVFKALASAMQMAARLGFSKAEVEL